MENLKVMEAACNFTDAVIENKEYFIEKGCSKNTYLVKTALSENKGSSALLAIVDKIGNGFDFWEVLPCRESTRNIILQEVQKFHEELQAAEQREKELKEEFEAWRANNGK